MRGVRTIEASRRGQAVRLRHDVAERGPFESEVRVHGFDRRGDMSHRRDAENAEVWSKTELKRAFVGRVTEWVADACLLRRRQGRR